MFVLGSGFAMLGRMSAIALLAASACQAGPGSACGDGYCGVGYECRPDDGAWQCVRAVDACAAGCGSGETLAEREPNEDGSPEIGGSFQGNDFATANADGPHEADIAISATLVPPGDEDVFAVANRGADPAWVRFETHEAGAGLDMPCSAIDTVLYIRDAGGRSLAQSDDVLGLCAAVEHVIEPGGTVYAHVLAFGDRAAIPWPGYWLVIRRGQSPMP